MKNFRKMWLFQYEKFQKNVDILVRKISKKCGYSSMKNFKKMWLFQSEKFQKMWLFQYEKFQKNVAIHV